MAQLALSVTIIALIIFLPWYIGHKKEPYKHSAFQWFTGFCILTAIAFAFLAAFVVIGFIWKVSGQILEAL